jgi:SAM-dependent methyltransferase
VIQPGAIDLRRIEELQRMPELFAPGDAVMWTDPHISMQLLAAHLDPTNDAASLRPEKIARTEAWLARTLNLTPGRSVLDLGCGPGLYASRFAAAGLSVTGIDYSRASIEYAERHAREQGLDIAYRCEDYRSMEAEASRYDAIFLIYGDFCTMSRQDRSTLLRRIHHALKDDGSFVLDVSTPELARHLLPRNSWRCHGQSGFWSQGEHLVLEQGFTYPGAIRLDQYIVIRADGAMSVYRNWFQDYRRESLSLELDAHGFSLLEVWNDLMGTPYSEESGWMGVVAKKS